MIVIGDVSKAIQGEKDAIVKESNCDKNPVNKPRILKAIVALDDVQLYFA